MASIQTPAALAGPPGPGVQVTQDTFGRLDGRPVERYTLDNGRVSVQVITLGAIITAIRAPDAAGRQEDIVLGFDNPEDYLADEPNAHFGATVGRVANRIGNASFTLDGQEYKLYPFPNGGTSGTFTLHGGRKGWDKAVWNASRRADGVVFSLLSPDGDEGFPGTVLAQVSYRLTPDNRLLIYVQATANKATPINVVNHSYFNLGGHASGAKEVYRTRIKLNADRYTLTDAAIIPTGEFGSVTGTSLDLRSPRLLGEVLPRFDFDHNYVVNRDLALSGELALVARAEHEPSGRTLEVHADQPGVQFYTSNGLPEASKPPVIGKDGAQYYRHGAFCLETQNFPDAIHHEGRFPTSVLRPGLLYTHNMVFKFGVRGQCGPAIKSS